MWIFGYGSLMWRPGFDYCEKQVAVVANYARELWQGSPDHRGVPGAPGRVATLVARPGANCVGIAFRIAPADSERTLAQLDEREQGGYDRHNLHIELADGSSVPALTYIGLPGNPHFLGPASQVEMVATIQSRSGPSGHNREYVLELVQMLRQLGLSDPGMEQLADALGPL